MAFYPTESGANAYCRLSKEAIERQGYRTISFETFLRNGRTHQPTPIVLNWFDEVNGNDLFHFCTSYLKKSIGLRIARPANGRLIYVVHNRCPHDSTSSLKRLLSKRLRLLLCKKSTAIIVLCDETEGVLKDQLSEKLFEKVRSKVLKIPHPSYEMAYKAKPVDYRKRLGIEAGGPVILFTGMIRPYKNIELVIQVARTYADSSGKDLGQKAKPVFVIAGMCADEGYLTHLRHLSKNLDNVVFIPEFTPDPLLPSLIKCADVLMLPYNLQSSLNSGTCILAFTYDRTVICPRNGTMKEYPPDLTFAYDYPDDDHFQALYRAFLSFMAEWENDPGSIRARGAVLGEIVRKEGSLDSIGLLYKRVFEESCK